MPPVHRLGRAVVCQGVTLVGYHGLALVEHIHNLHDGASRVGEERCAARIAHLAHLGRGSKELGASREVVDVKMALAILAHIEVEALRTHDDTLGGC